MSGKTRVGGYALVCQARRIASDQVWERYAPHLPGRLPDTRGGSLPKCDNRTVLEAILWIARAGSSWRDRPAEFGNWNRIYQRFRRWRQDGVFNDDWFARLTADLDLALDTVIVDGTLIKVHQHGTGAPKADALTTPDDSRAAEAIGASRGGLTIRLDYRDCGADGPSGAVGWLCADAGQCSRAAFVAGPAGRSAGQRTNCGLSIRRQHHAGAAGGAEHRNSDTPCSSDAFPRQPASTALV